MPDLGILLSYTVCSVHVNSIRRCVPATLASARALLPIPRRGCKRGGNCVGEQKGERLAGQWVGGF